MPLPPTTRCVREQLRHSSPAERPVVVVIGGGLAGLSAAFGLRIALGLRVEIVVLEARTRLGGRVHPLAGGVEAGGEPPIVHRGPLLRWVEALGFEARSYVSTRDDADYRIEARSVHASQWSHHGEGRYPAPLDHRPPARAWASLLSRVPAPAGWAGDTLGALARVDPAWSTMSFEDLLDRLEVPAELRPLVPAMPHVLESPHRLSALSVLMRGWSAPPEDRRYHFAGSMKRLLDAAAEYPDHIHLDCGVRTVRLRDDGRHEIRAGDGRSWIADHVVLALPARSAARIEVSPEWCSTTRRALGTCEYGPVVKVFMRSITPAGPPGGWPLCTHPDEGFDTCRPVHDPRTRVTPSRGPDVLGLQLTFIGDRARRLLARTSEGTDIETAAARALWRVHPQVLPYLHPEHTAVWSGAGGPGALPYFPPRADIPRLYAALQQPSHRRHLAGDHTEPGHAGWDGAVASGLRAARQVASALLRGDP